MAAAAGTAGAACGAAPTPPAAGPRPRCLRDFCASPGDSGGLPGPAGGAEGSAGAVEGLRTRVASGGDWSEGRRALLGSPSKRLEAEIQPRRATRSARVQAAHAAGIFW